MKTSPVMKKVKIVKETTDLETMVETFSYELSPLKYYYSARKDYSSLKEKK